MAHSCDKDPSLVMMKHTPRELLVFDLGNVILHYDFQRKYKHWSDLIGRPEDEIRSKFQLGEVFHQFERGQVSSAFFMETMNRVSGLGFAEDDFRSGWNAGFLDVIDGVPNLLAILRSRGYRMAALSNTNAIHFDSVIRVRYGDQLEMFDRVFCSHEIGHRKPERQAYEIIQKTYRTDSSEIVFLDDLEENISAARTLGWRGIVVNSYEQMKRELERELGFPFDAG